MRRKILHNQINLSDIQYIKAKFNYSTMFLNGNAVTIAKTLKSIHNDSKTSSFCRCHRSHIVNLNFVQGINFYDLTIQMKDNTLIPISRRSKVAVREKWHSFLKNNF